MAFINLLHNGYQGKLGETVGQKWKNQRTVRTYNEHNNSKSEAQLEQRAHYKELITTASLAYPTRVNFPKSQAKKMNEFNYYTSLLEKIAKEGVPAADFLYTDIFNRRGICHPVRYTMNSIHYLFICVPESVETVYLKDYKLVIISNFNTTAKKYVQVDITFPYTGSPRQFKAGQTLKGPKRGFLWRMVGYPDYNGVLYAAVGRKKGSTWEYSGIFDLRKFIFKDSTDFEAPVPPITIIR